MARADNVYVKITGTERLARNMKVLTAEIKARVEAAITDQAENVATTARENCPVRTGALKRSIRVEVGDGGMFAAVKAGGMEAPHAHLIEFGTRKMRARPYMVPALEQNKDAITRAIDDAIGDSLK
jgi:HK97 gp10 family phage protein